MSVQLKTMAMKARVANIARKKVWELSKYTPSSRPWGFYNFDQITKEQKIQFFDEMAIEIKAMHQELKKYKRNRAEKKKIEGIRKVNGYYTTGKGAKKKTSKVEYENLQKMLASGQMLIKKVS